MSTELYDTYLTFNERVNRVRKFLDHYEKLCRMSIIKHNEKDETIRRMVVIVDDMEDTLLTLMESLSLNLMQNLGEEKK